MKKAIIQGVLFLSFVAATTHAGINDGLVAYYPFNGNADDQSGNGNHGGVYGAMMTADRNGNPDSAYSFDGVDDYIRLLSKVTFGTGNTFTFWAKSDIIGAQHLIAGVDFRNRIGINGAALYLEYGHWDNGDYFGLQHGGDITNWNHFALIYNGATVELYVNGQPADSETKIATSISVDNVAGKDFSSAWGYFDGVLDEIRFYNRVLSETEIQKL